MNAAGLLRQAMCGLLLVAVAAPTRLHAQQTAKPVLHGKHWVAITGKPLAATAGAMMFQKGGNAVDAACAMLAATATMWDVLSWGGETQALIYDPRTRKVVGINALGVAPTGATAEFFKKKDMKQPPEFGPLAAVTPGTPGGLMVMLSEYGTLSLREVLGPAIQMAEEGYPMEAQAANGIEKNKDKLKQWRYSREVMLPHLGQEREAPQPGEVFRQKDLAATLKKLVEAEQQALKAGKNRKQAIQAAYDRFYKGDIARELVRGVQEEGGLITLEDLARWKVHIEEPVKTTYKGVEVYKLTTWVQGPVLLQALNILETQDLKSMGYNSSRYIHALYQAMNLAFADRDFYYGDPYFPPSEPVRGLLSKEYAKERAKLINWEKNDPKIKPGDPYRFQGESNPYLKLLEQWPPAPPPTPSAAPSSPPPATPAPATKQPAPQPSGPTTPVPPQGARPTNPQQASLEDFERAFYAGTTTVQAADEKGWVVSITPSGGWVPAVIAGRTGVGLSQRMQSFVLDPAENPFNVLEPGKRPRATLTPSLALKDGKPFLSFAVQGGDSQDQNLLQFFLNVVEFGMTVQEAAEAANINSFQMRTSFGDHSAKPGRLLLHEAVPPWVRSELKRMGYELTFEPRTSGPINAIYFDHKHGTLWGGSSHHGEDYGIAW
jgi:gamma-glutamyltranspeptidase/glutathione hydrolase